MTNQDFKLSDLLKRLEHGKLPVDVFNQVARLTVTPVVEIVPFFTKDEVEKVLLFQRTSEDTLWPNMFYIPGTIILSTDEPGTLDDSLNRVINGKLSGIEITDLKFVNIKLIKSVRGMELALVYSARIINLMDKSNLYDVNKLPDNMIEGHKDFILMAKLKE